MEIGNFQGRLLLSKLFVFPFEKRFTPTRKNLQTLYTHLFLLGWTIYRKEIAYRKQEFPKSCFSCKKMAENVTSVSIPIKPTLT